MDNNLQSLPQMTAEQAIENIGQALQYCMAAGAFKTFGELDAARYSLQVVQTELINLKTTTNDKEKKTVG